VPAATADGSNSSNAVIDIHRDASGVFTVLLRSASRPRRRTVLDSAQWLSTIGYPPGFSRQIAFPLNALGLEIIIQIPILRIPVPGPSRINKF
jgi:hypothetical protein